MQRGCRRAADSSIIYELCREDINAASSLWDSILGLSNPAYKRRHLFNDRGSGDGAGIFNRRDWLCKVKLLAAAKGTCPVWTALARLGLVWGHFVCAFPILYYFIRGFQECKQTVLQAAGGPATRSGRAMSDTLLGGTNPSPHKRCLN